MSESDQQIQFELKERLDYPSILTSALLTLKKANAEPTLNPSRIRNIIIDIYTDIPDSWYDTEFEKDIQNCLTVKFIDVRPEFSGVKMSIELCKQNNITTVKKTKDINWYRLKRAIVNLLDRRAMLVRREKIELSTGENLQFATLEELEKAFNLDADEEIEDNNNAET